MNYSLNGSFFMAYLCAIKQYKPNSTTNYFHEETFLFGCYLHSHNNVRLF